jgi:hypothetical protein
LAFPNPWEKSAIDDRTARSNRRIAGCPQAASMVRQIDSRAAAATFSPAAWREAALAQNERVSGLKRASALAQLSDAALQNLAEKCKWRQHRAGEQILGRQDFSTDVYFLLVGTARAISYSSEGKAVVFADLTPGAMFGEIAAIDRRPRSASIEAVEACEIASLSADEFEKLMLREPSVAVAVLRKVIADMRRLSERVFEYAGGPEPDSCGAVAVGGSPGPAESGGDTFAGPVARG